MVGINQHNLSVSYPNIFYASILSMHILCSWVHLSTDVNKDEPRSDRRASY